MSENTQDNYDTGTVSGAFRVVEQFLGNHGADPGVFKCLDKLVNHAGNSAKDIVIVDDFDERLPEPYLSLARSHYDGEPGTQCCDLEDAFEWGSTPEGRAFWSAVAAGDCPAIPGEGSVAAPKLREGGHPKIVQIMQPRGKHGILGLGDDGVVYMEGAARWVQYL